MMHMQDAKKLAETNKTEPIWEKSTPRWLLQFVEQKGIENITFRINKVCSINKVTVGDHEYDQMSHDNIQYQQKPTEIELVNIETLIKVPSKIHDVMNYPHNQLVNQLRLTVENIRETQENYFINNPDTGLISQCAKKSRIIRYNDVVSPNVLDDLLALVWNKPSFYLMHPRILADFCKSCNSLGLNTGSSEYLGYQFVTWRGLPIITSDKIPLSAGTLTNIFLIRTGFDDSGVVQLHNITPTKSGYPGIFIETSATDQFGTVNTRVSLYTNIAILSDESIACATVVYN